MAKVDYSYLTEPGGYYFKVFREDGTFQVFLDTDKVTGQILKIMVTAPRHYLQETHRYVDNCRGSTEDME